MESLVNLVAQACHLEEALDKKGKTGIQKSQGSKAVFLHDPDHRIHFIYTPKHNSWMNQIEIWFGIINRKLLRRKSYISTEELKESIEKNMEQNRRKNKQRRPTVHTVSVFATSALCYSGSVPPDP